jgi:carbon catabolite-derepressing protein kinase
LWGGDQGLGAYGTVFKVIHKATGQPYALKQMSKKQLKDQKMIGQVGTEIKIMYRLRHPHIVRLHGHFDEEDSIFLVLEYAAKGPLYKLLDEKGPMSEALVRKLVGEVLSALEHLHSQKPPIIHRDIKPENILLDQALNAKLADFGWSNF